MSAAENARETLELMLQHLGVTCEVTAHQGANGIVLNIDTPDPDRLLEGEGKNLKDLQYLLNRILSTENPDMEPVQVDVAGVRASKEKELIERVKSLVEQVKATGEEVILEPMNAYDRRIVHNTFQNEEIETFSPPDKARLKSIIIRPRLQKDNV